MHLHFPFKELNLNSGNHAIFWATAVLYETLFPNDDFYYKSLQYPSQNLMLQQWFEIDIKEYRVINQINSGTFGIVYLAENESTGEKVAAKVIKQIISTNEHDDKYKQKINREIVVLVRCQHPTII